MGKNSQKHTSTSMLDLEGLAEELDMEDEKNVILDLPEKVNIEKFDPEYILAESIARTREMLDLIRENMKEGNYSARLFEVASLLISQMSAAAEKSLNNENTKIALAIKKEYNDLKSRELDIKERLELGNDNNENKNIKERIIVATREDIMKILERPQKQLDGGNNEKSEG